MAEQGTITLSGLPVNGGVIDANDGQATAINTIVNEFNKQVPVTKISAEQTASNFSPAATGFVSATVNLARWQQIAKWVFIQLDISGVSNSTALTYILPVAAKSSIRYSTVRATDNGGTPVPGEMDLTAASTTVTCYPTPASGNWTAGGTKRIEVSFLYEAN